MIITRLQAQNKTIALYLDGDFACSLSFETVLKHRLRKGLQITDVQLKQLQSESGLTRWRDKALNFISIRPRSKKELIEYFRRLGADESIRDIIVADLSEKKIIDDLEFTRWFVLQRDQFRPKGRRVLELELRSKGIAPEVIKEALNHKDKDSELIQAQTLINKKLKVWSRYPALKLRNKIQGYLIRRGFSFDVTREVLKQVNFDFGDLT